MKEGMLEKIEDIEVDGEKIPASVLGYRINSKFVKTIVLTNKRVAEMYIADGGADMAVPPLKALLHIMAKGEYEGMTLESPEFRAMWKRDNIIKSDWYKARLQCFQEKEATRLERGLQYTQNFVKGPDACAGDWKGKQICEDLQLHDRISSIKSQLDKVKKADYLTFLQGSLGVDPAIYSAPNNNFDRTLPSVLQ